MGCSQNHYKHVYAEVPNLEKFREDFSKLQISEGDVGKLYTLFCKIDMDGSGSIEVLELLMFLDVERTRFTKRVFSIFVRHFIILTRLFCHNGFYRMQINLVLLILKNLCNILFICTCIIYIFI